jgi:hypothetical protein
MARAQVVAQFTACVMRHAAGSGFVRAKRVRQPVDAAGIERDDIEAARRQRAPPAGQEMLRGMHEPRALSRIDARGGMRILPASPRPHFDEYDHAAFIGHDEIDLAAAARHVARDESQTLPLQIFERTRLERIAERFGHGFSIKVVDKASCSRVAK